MAPSRGFALLRRITLTRPPLHHCTCRAYTSFTDTLSNPANKIQSYISRSTDPYLNLSIEDHILRTSSPDSTILFLYINRPCVVIGRNQNPWTEVNLGILDVYAQDKSRRFRAQDTEPPAIGDIELVRRRSGGGTVFHDEGNLNWSITSPLAHFTRDKHAELVVRALRKMGVERSRVNERHDIVLDQGHEKRASDPGDTHRTPWTVDEGAALSPRPLKVSGSAYKLTRGRALHHATTLLASPNLHIIPQYLHAPGKPFIEAKGVESVSSPVGNIGLEVESFQRQLQREFAEFYAPDRQIAVETVGDEYLQIPEISRGYEELRTRDWLLSQTPQFTLKIGPSSTELAHIDARLEMTVHHGVIKDCQYESPRCSAATVNKLTTLLGGQKLQNIEDWDYFILSNEGLSGDDDGVSEIVDILQKYLPIPLAPVS